MIVLPWSPSLNHYWRHVGRKVLISAEGRKYRTIVGIHVMGYGYRVRIGSARCRVHILTHQPDARRRDLDNLTKALLDSLSHAGVYDDDSQIDDLHIVRGSIDRKNPHVCVSVEAIA